MNARTIAKLALPLVAATGLGACATMPQDTAVTNCGCSGSDCKKDVTITYGVDNSGHSVFKVKEKTEIDKGDRALVFKLDPRKANPPLPDYETADVTVVGKPDDQKNAWITSTTGKYDPDGQLVICIPDNLAANVDYYYEIEVDGFGKLDPRVIVK